MNVQPNIRLASSKDAATIAEVGRVAFTESFGPLNTPDDLHGHLDITYRPELISQQMESGAKYVIAEVDQVAAGFGKLRKRLPPNCIPGMSPLEVHQIYLLAAFHRRGIGSMLMRKLIELAKVSGGDGIYLGVYEKADWGIAFYQSCGFQKVGEHVFRVGQDDQTDWLMYLNLVG